MIELLVAGVTALVVIAAATVAGPRLGVAAPLLLVAAGVVASFLPVPGPVHVEPEWILEGLLPPLLYASAVSMPAMNFRREFAAISGLSVVLVAGSAVLLGLFFMLVIPGIGFWWGVALGAIISPTDAVATSMLRNTPVSPRVMAILDGESLLNDATALVVLRTAIVAAAASFSFWGALGAFAWSVVAAVAVGVLAGRLNLLVRARVTNSTVNTVISFTVPFAAAVPAGLLGASGLVAAVAAGLVTGIGAPRVLSPQHRMSDTQNWRTVELVLEGLVFLAMGLQVRPIVQSVPHSGTAVLIAAGALGLTLLIRAAYVSGLLGVFGRRLRDGERLRERLRHMHDRLGTDEGRRAAFGTLRPHRQPSARELDRLAVRVTRGLADLTYFLRAPLGRREGAVVVWAGMRGAVTVAAAQTLGEDTPQRSLIVLVAYTVAVMSLIVQGSTVARVVRAVTPTTADRASASEEAGEEWARIGELMRRSGATVPAPTRPENATAPEAIVPDRAHRLAVIRAQRSALLDARDNGIFDADVLAGALADLDAAQIALEMRAAPAGRA